MLPTTIFDSRRTVWNNLGVEVKQAATSADAIHLAGLDWQVLQKKVYTEDGERVHGAYSNVRSSDNKPLGIVGERYKIVQNEDAFKFTDALLGEGVTYETAGSLKDGRIIWLLAKMPDKYTILGDKVDPYLVFTNSHDGSGAVKVCMTPIRVVCQNTLNAALKKARNKWTARHVGSIEYKMNDAIETLKFAHEYMEAVNNTFEDLYKIKLSDFDVHSLVNKIVPIDDNMGKAQKENAETVRNDILYRFKNAPDLRELEYTGARLVQAVSDSSAHIEPFRRTANFEENRFKRTLEKNDLLDTTLNVLSVG